jgi:hypothetical protein
MNPTAGNDLLKPLPKFLQLAKNSRSTNDNLKELPLPRHKNAHQRPHVCASVPPQVPSVLQILYEIAYSHVTVRKGSVFSFVIIIRNVQTQIHHR